MNDETLASPMVGMPALHSWSGLCLGLLAPYRGWEEPLPKKPQGVVVHKDHVLLGRKLSGKSQRVLPRPGGAPDGWSSVSDSSG